MQAVYNVKAAREPPRMHVHVGSSKPASGPLRRLPPEAASQATRRDRGESDDGHRSRDRFRDRIYRETPVTREIRGLPTVLLPEMPVIR